MLRALWWRLHHRHALARAPASAADDLFGALNELLIRCTRLTNAGVSGLDPVREQVVALAIKHRAQQLNAAPPDAQARRANLKLAAAKIDALLSALEAKTPGVHVSEGTAGAPAAHDDGAAATFREQLVDEEDGALDAYVQQAREEGDEALVARLDVLCEAIDSMRAIEENFDFHAGLLQAHAKLAAAHGWSEANFSYGSTPYHSWRALHDACPPLARAMRACGEAGECVVFGSSLGWLCVYAACTFGVRAEGYEIVRPLVQLGTKLAKRHGLDGQISMHAADMLGADISRARVVTLTSKCWDAGLKQAVATKLAAELPVGRCAPTPAARAALAHSRGAPARAPRLQLNCAAAPPPLRIAPLLAAAAAASRTAARSLVVDYSDELARSQAPATFEVLTRVHVAVSWAKAQEMAVMRKLVL